jgi:hypothetical protein
MNVIKFPKQASTVKDVATILMIKIHVVHQENGVLNYQGKIQHVLEDHAHIILEEVIDVIFLRMFRHRFLNNRDPIKSPID